MRVFGIILKLAIEIVYDGSGTGDCDDRKMKIMGIIVMMIMIVMIMMMIILIVIRVMIIVSDDN